MTKDTRQLNNLQEIRSNFWSPYVIFTIYMLCSSHMFLTTCILRSSLCICKFISAFVNLFSMIFFMFQSTRIFWSSLLFFVNLCQALCFVYLYVIVNLFTLFIAAFVNLYMLWSSLCFSQHIFSGHLYCSLSTFILGSSWILSTFVLCQYLCFVYFVHHGFLSTRFLCSLAFVNLCGLSRTFVDLYALIINICVSLYAFFTSSLLSNFKFVPSLCFVNICQPVFIVYQYGFFSL